MGTMADRFHSRLQRTTPEPVTAKQFTNRLNQQILLHKPTIAAGGKLSGAEKLAEAIGIPDVVGGVGYMFRDLSVLLMFSTYTETESSVAPTTIDFTRGSYEEKRAALGMVLEALNMSALLKQLDERFAASVSKDMADRTLADTILTAVDGKFTA